MENKELKKLIEKSNKRLALVYMVWSVFFTIPMLIVYYQYPLNPIVTTLSVIIWWIIICIGAVLSPKICNMIWK